MDNSARRLLVTAALLCPLSARASSTEGFDTEAVVGEARLITAQFVPPGRDLDHSGGGFGRTPSRPGETPVRSCVTPDGINVNLRRASLNDLLDFLDHAPSARPATAELRRRLAAGELVVEQIDPRRVPPGVMARYAYTPGQRRQRIEVDLTAELGVLAVQFYHELTHSVDPDVPPFYDEFDRRYAGIQAARRALYQAAADRLRRRIDDVSFGDLSAAERVELRRLEDFENDAVYGIELRAFEAQHALIEQLIRRIPCYDGYLREQQSVNGYNTRYENIPEHIYCAYGKYPPQVPFNMEPGVGCAVYRRYGGTLPDPR